MGLAERVGGMPDRGVVSMIGGAAEASAPMLAAGGVLGSAAPRARCSAFAQSAHSLPRPATVGRSQSRHFIAAPVRVKGSWVPTVVYNSRRVWLIRWSQSSLDATSVTFEARFEPCIDSRWRVICFPHRADSRP